MKIDQYVEQLAVYGLAPELCDQVQQLLIHLHSQGVDEVLANGPSNFFAIGSAGTHRLENIQICGSDAFMEILLAMAELEYERLDLLRPFAGGSIPGLNVRWQIVLPPIARPGPLLSMRKIRFELHTIDHFIDDGSWIDRIRELAIAACPLVVCGPTASGKTTFVSSLLREFAIHERVLIIETTPELPMTSDHWLRLVTRQASVEGRGGVPIASLFVAGLRLRPDRIVIGEIRDEEATTVVQALATGHTGFLTTIHGSSASDVKLRLNMMCRDQAVDFSQLPEMHLICLERGYPPRIRDLTTLRLSN